MNNQEIVLKRMRTEFDEMIRSVVEMNDKILIYALKFNAKREDFIKNYENNESLIKELENVFEETIGWYEESLNLEKKIGALETDAVTKQS